MPPSRRATCIIVPHGHGALSELPLYSLILVSLVPFCAAINTTSIDGGFVSEDMLLSCNAPLKRSIINYMALHTCFLGGRSWMSVPLLLAMVVFAFYVLAQAAQHHFSPVVGRMAEMLHLSASTGGVTLLALGNGAPDVFASIAAVWGGNARIGLGAIVSAGLFVTSFVVGFVALAAAPFPLNPIPFIRDICFYLLGASLLFFIYLSGEVHAWQAIGLVSLYILFVIVVFGMDQNTRSLKYSVSDVKSSIDLPNLSCDLATPENGASPSQVGGSAIVQQRKQSPPFSDGRHGSEDSHIKIRDSDESVYIENGKAKSPLSVLVGLVISMLCHDRREFDICKKAQKVYLVWQFPISVILRSTIPAVDLSVWNRFYAAANLVFCPMIFLYIISSAISPYRRIVFLVPGVNFPLWLIILFQASILGAAYFFITKEQPRSELPMAVVTAFVMSVFWISMIAGELLGCLVALGTILKLPPALLGLTVLAWGNSIGDLVADVAVARAGQPAMAMAGCFAGPMFNMLVGFGLALAMKAVRSYPAPYNLEYNPSIVTAFCFLFTSLLSSLLVIAWSKFQVPRLWGFCLIGLYGTFVLVSVSNANLL